MLLVDANGNTYRAHFRHTHDGEGPKIRRRGMSGGIQKIERWWVVTECTLHRDQCATNARPCETPNSVTGIAKCSRSDSFDRRKGLKLAFQRALEQMFPSHLRTHSDHEMRTALWASFWTRVRRPRQHR